MARLFELLVVAVALGAAAFALLVLYMERLREARRASDRSAELEGKLARVLALLDQSTGSTDPDVGQTLRERARDRRSEPAPESGVERSVVIIDAARDRILVGAADTLDASFRMPSREPLLSELAEDPDIADLVVEFAVVLANRADSLLSAFEHDDTENLKRIVHQLKGAAGGYGFPSISEQARVVESALTGSNERAQVREAVDGLAGLCFRASLGAATQRTPQRVA
jgi:HPt (histidine-containing phosphotransfer) domain-containing protein